MNCPENRYIFFNPPPRMARGSGGREGGDREGEREREAGREGGARAKPGNQLIPYMGTNNSQSHKRENVYS